MTDPKRFVTETINGWADALVDLIRTVDQARVDLGDDDTEEER